MPFACVFNPAPPSCTPAARAQPNQCVQLGGPLLSRCQAELEEVQKIYPLNSETPITDAQVEQILSVAASMNLPSQQCCQAARSFAGARCSCDTSLPPLLGAVGLDVTPTGLQSADKFTSQACKFEPVTC